MPTKHTWAPAHGLQLQLADCLQQVKDGLIGRQPTGNHALQVWPQVLAVYPAWGRDSHVLKVMPCSLADVPLQAQHAAV